MRVAGPSLPVEKSRSRIDASSSATLFAVVQGNDELLDAPCRSDPDDMRSSNSRAFACPISVATANGQSRNASRTEAGCCAPDAAPGRHPDSFGSSVEFIRSTLRGWLTATKRHDASAIADQGKHFRRHGGAGEPMTRMDRRGRGPFGKSAVLACFPECQIDAFPAYESVLAVRERRDAVKCEPHRPTPHRGVAVFQSKAA